MKNRHIPIRTCLGCRKRRPKQELLRVAPGAGGLTACAQGGRGRYVCPEATCIARTLKRRDVWSLIGGPVSNGASQTVIRSLLGENALDDTHPGRGIGIRRSGGGAVA